MGEETKNVLVVKRTGEEVPYNRKKIVLAIEGANKDANYEMTDSDVMSVALQVNIKIQEKDRIQVEAIQNLVEDTLMLNNYTETARQYIRYRQRHEQKRAASQHLMESYNDLLFSDSEKMNLKRDNANINGDAPMGIMLKLGAEGSKTYADNYGIPEEYVKPDKEGLYHIHDKDFSFITFNCCQLDLGKMLKDGFSTGHGFLREPNSIRSAAALACIAIQSNQNDMFKLNQSY